MTEQIKKVIEKYEHPGDFTHPDVTKQILDKASSDLQISIPEEYTDFLYSYGHGGINGIEIIGIGKQGNPIFVAETIKYREYGLPDNLIVIENCDEWVYCIDCNTGTVVSWSDGIIENVYPDFNSYLEDRLNDAIENM